MNVYDQIAGNNRKTIAILLAFPIALFATVFLFAFIIVKSEVLLPNEPIAPKLTTDLIERVSVRPDALRRVMDKDPGIAGRLSGARSKPDTMKFSMTLTMMVYPWLLLAVLIWIAVAYRVGGKMILSMAKSHQITPGDNRELFNLVENTAIMAGLPTPEIYLIDDESLNAFAVGRNPDEASIALTAGIVKKLDKDELQAVIAHELSHIGNRDTRLMIIIIAGIGCFTFLGELMLRVVLRGSRGSRNNGKAVVIALAIAIVCLVFGYIVAPILRLALSRRREFLADATAAKITRDPEALARALQKIDINPRVESLDASALAGNMCIASPVKMSFIKSLYMTHPPIRDRVAALMRMTGREKVNR